MDLKQLISRSSKLYVLPSIYAEFNRKLEDPNTSNIQLADIIQYDAGLSSFLLKIVNSAFYNFSSNIGSIAHAMSIIGRRELATLVLGKSVVNAFSRSSIDSKCLQRHWEQSLCSALFAKNIASLTDSEPHTSETLFVAGLISGIGRLVIWDEYPHLATDYHEQETDASYCEIEKALLGFDHKEVGANLVKRWRLPDIFIQTTYYEWKPSVRYSNNGVPIISLAKCIAKQMSTSPQMSTIDFIDPVLIQFLQLNEKYLFNMMSESSNQLSELKSTFL